MSPKSIGVRLSTRRSLIFLRTHQLSLFRLHVMLRPDGYSIHLWTALRAPPELRHFKLTLSNQIAWPQLRQSFPLLPFSQCSAAHHKLLNTAAALPSTIWCQPPLCLIKWLTRRRIRLPLYNHSLRASQEVGPTDHSADWRNWTWSAHGHHRRDQWDRQWIQNCCSPCVHIADDHNFVGAIENQPENSDPSTSLSYVWQRYRTSDVRTSELLRSRQSSTVTYWFFHPHLAIAWIPLSSRKLWMS